MIGDQRDDHRSHHSGRGQRREQPEDQERTGAQFGERGEDRVHPAGPDADGFEPPRRPRQLAAAERVVPAMRHHGATNHQAQHQRRDVHAIHASLPPR
jgi:hypothetical protein